MRLKDKIAIVTGGASGIGFATAEAFAREGALVTVADKNGEAAAKVAKHLGTKARSFTVDVAKSSQVKAMIEDTAKVHGRLDVLFNNAGYGVTGDVTQVSEDDWDALLAVNVNGVFYGCKHAIPIMARGGGGSIVNIASAAAFLGMPNAMLYAGVKAGVLGLTRASAVELGPQRVRVNAICPGSVQTEGVRINVDAAMVAKRIARTPLGRLGEVVDIASAALFLASDESSWMTGESVLVDGGATHAVL
jgi:NAD(P)-dependent dehydrogenase (short-subunit alcohol dehydrogenase family)